MHDLARRTAVQAGGALHQPGPHLRRIATERLADAQADAAHVARRIVMDFAAQGLAGSVPVSGQDGDHAALNRIALGTQTVSVWKDARALGTQAVKIASLLADGKTMSEIPGAIKFAGGPKKVEMNTVLLTPIPITKDNLDVVIDAGWVSKPEICKGVTPGTVTVCD